MLIKHILVYLLFTDRTDTLVMLEVEKGPEIEKWG